MISSVFVLFVPFCGCVFYSVAGVKMFVPESSTADSPSPNCMFDGATYATEVDCSPVVLCRYWLHEIRAAYRALVTHSGIKPISFVA